MHFRFLLLILLLPAISVAQRLTGTVYSNNGDLLPFASITIKGTTKGASANDKAHFSFNLSKGSYTLVCQHIGFASQEKSIVIDGDQDLTFILKEQKLTMQEVVIKSNSEDPAYEIIRKAIAKRPYYDNQVKTFGCELYSKDQIKLKKLPARIFGVPVPEEDRKQMGIDSTGKGNIIYLSESMSTVNVQEPDKIKTEVHSSRVSGSNSFGFTFPVFISLYSNNVSLFDNTFSRRGFVSPIADGAIGFYKFKFLGNFWENGKMINSIQVTPRRSYEPLFTGIINITEDDWRIHSFNLTLTKKSQMEILDTLRISQLYVPVNDDVWRVKNQLISFDFNLFGVSAGGNFLSVYSDYDINRKYDRHFFDRVIIKYDTAVSKRSHDYWDSVRPMPLEPEEKLDYAVKDSIFMVMQDSANVINNIDSLKKRQGKLRPTNVLFNGIDRTHYGTKSRYRWGIDPLVYNSNYNTAEALNMTLSSYWIKDIKKRKATLSIFIEWRYGFGNNHLNPSLELEWRARGLSKFNKLRRWSLNISGGKRVSQFNKESPISELTNTASTLFYGNNFMKTYENGFAELEYRKRFENGFFFSLKALFEDRKPLNNITNYTINKSDTARITPNFPFEKIASQFTPHKAFLLQARLSFRPGQRYIQYPYTRVPIGSKLPLLAVEYTKGIPSLFGSDVDFDKWDFSISDERNLKLAGLLKYKIGIGGFFNAKTVFIQDYKHFNGNRTVISRYYVNSFQAASYYQNSTIDPFYSYAHIEHHFNGLLSNKIPLFKRLKWHFVGGANTFYVDANSNYVDFFVGLENIFKVFRVDLVWAYDKGKYYESAVRIGAGGIFSGGMEEDPLSKNRRRGRIISF